MQKSNNNNNSKKKVLQKSAPTKSSKKRARRNRKAQKIAKKIVKGDPRMGKNGMGQHEVLSNQTTAITISSVLDSANLWTIAVGYVTKAVEKGFLARQKEVYNTNYALQYLISVLENVASNGTPFLTELPYALSCICQAIKAKGAPFGSGGVKYTFTNEAQGQTPDNITLGSNVFDSKWTSGTPVPSLAANLFPVISYTGWPAYTPLLGSNAFQDLNTFMKDNGGNDYYRMVNVAAPTPLINDVSAFSVLQSRVGTGSTGAGGGFGALAQLEVPVFRPYLSTVNCNFVNSDVINRYGDCNVAWSGDGTFLGASIGCMFPDSEWGTNRWPKLHCVDFLEFGDVLAQWVVGISNAYLSSVSSQAPLSPPALAAIQCPLTLQEMLIVLRSVIMCAFKDSQASVQGLLPILPAIPSDNQFTPYLAGTNTCYLGGSDMTLPQPLVENIRALTARKVNPGTSTAEWFVPVLGQYFTDQLDEDDYTSEYNSSDGTVTTSPVFKPSDSVYTKKVTEKGIVKTALVAEVPISLIDGSYASGYACINNPARLKELTTLWNDWLTTTTQLSTYSVPLLKLGTEEGINALCSITWTRYRATPPAPKPKVGTEEVLDTRRSLSANKHIYSTVYGSAVAVAESSQGIILSAPYETILKSWILPVMKIGNFSTAQITAQKWQALMHEPYLATLSQGEDGTFLSQMHASYAAAMVKGATASQSSWTMFFNEMALQGRGGILSGLVASLVGSAVPSLSGVANSIAGALPF